MGLVGRQAHQTQADVPLPCRARAGTGQKGSGSGIQRPPPQAEVFHQPGINPWAGPANNLLPFLYSHSSN